MGSHFVKTGLGNDVASAQYFDTPQQAFSQANQNLQASGGGVPNFLAQQTPASVTPSDPANPEAAPDIQGGTLAPNFLSQPTNLPKIQTPSFLQASNNPQVANKAETKMGKLFQILGGAASGAGAGAGSRTFGEGFARAQNSDLQRKEVYNQQQQQLIQNQRQVQADKNVQAEADRQAAEAPLNTKIKQQTIQANAKALEVKNQSPEELFDSRTETATKLNLTGDAKVRFQATGQLPEDFGKKDKPETLDDKLVKDYVTGGMTETQAIEKVNKDKRTHISINNGVAGFGNLPDNAGATGDAALKGVPNKVATLVKGIANYDFDPSVLSNRNNQRANVLALVKQYDPTYDQTQYGVKKDVRKAFTSGDASKNIRSLNTAIGHLDQLQKAAAAVDSGNYPALNSIANKFSVASGDDPVTTFNAIANAVIGETASVYKGSGATDQEIHNVQNTFDAAQSPKQKGAAVRTTIKLFGSRLHALEAQYAEAMGKPADFSILNDESRKIVDGIDGPGGSSSKATHVFNPATGKVEAK